MDGKSEKLVFPTRFSFSNAKYSPTMSRRSLEGTNISSNLQSDIVFNVDGVAFALHKAPLMARSGKIRKLLGDSFHEGDLSPRTKPLIIEFSNFPGGPEIFELSARFCYGITFELTTTDIAPLRCAAEFLEMTGEENLIGRTEAFLNEVVFESVEKSARVLHSCEGIMALAEETRLVSRCIDVIASKVCYEEQKRSAALVRKDSRNQPRRLNNGYEASLWNLDIHTSRDESSSSGKVKGEYWWVECLLPLRFNLYQRVFTAMKASGLPCEALTGLLMQYAHKFLRELEKQNAKQMVRTSPSIKSSRTRQVSFESSPKRIQPHEQRIILEMIVSLIPGRGALFPINFLLILLRKAILLDTTVACRLDLERRIGLQLEQATVDDLLIPLSSSNAGDPMFDVDVVMRVLISYLEQEENCFTSDNGDPNCSLGSQKGIQNVSKLMDLYLAEVAPDPNLDTTKFVSVAELFPGYARVLDDGLYRAIDIFLKAHPTLSDKEKKKVCKVLDCRKLSREACLHAAQNDRLPVQVMVQMLYFEQTRMRDAIGVSDRPSNEMRSGSTFTGRECNKGGVTLQRQNQELMEEVARLKMLVSELQKENAALKQGREKLSGSNHNSGSFLSAITRRLGKIFSSKNHDTVRTRHPPRPRRHSVS